MVAAHMQGFAITAFDTDVNRLDERQAGTFDPAEPGVAEYLAQHAQEIQFTSQSSDLNLAELVIIALDTATDQSGNIDLTELTSLTQLVLQQVDPEIPVILMSQVPPGFTRAVGAGRARLFYQVETLIFGDGLRRALEPERYIFGCSDNREIPESVEKWHAAGQCPVLSMSLESAELAKMSINTFLAAQLMTTSTLAELAASIGADWSDIAETLRLDRRIGMHAYLTPGMGIGGTNIKRDLVGLAALAQSSGTCGQLFDDFLEGSEYYLAWMQRVVEGLLGASPGLRLGILGLAYKPGTTSTMNSPGIELARRFKEHIDVCVHDPHVPSSVPTSLRIRTTDDPLELIEASDVIALACDWPEYRELARGLQDWAGIALIDPNNFLEMRNVQRQRSYQIIPLGCPISHPVT